MSVPLISAGFQALKLRYARTTELLYYLTGLKY
uniref:Uncharacterized protein n=1 Tax=Arundo donax TaxID=35708 RepID=A0A0A9G6M4_ARUDO